MKRTSTIARLLFSRKWLLPTVAVLLGMTLLARLGFWQLDRLQQRRDSNAQLQLALESPPLPIDAATVPDDLTNLKDREVRVTGKFDYTQQILLLVQNWSGRAGVNLVTPLVIDDGKTAVLVDRGWIPDADSSPDNLIHFDEPGEQLVNGYIALSQTLSRANANTAADSPKQEWYRIDVEAIQQQMPYQLLPVYISQAPAPEGNVELPFRRLREIDLSEGPHLGYAVQWFIFSVMLGIIYIIYINKAISRPEAQ